jgi:hypothetical protein
MTHERKDVWPTEYITEEGIYPAVMARLWQRNGL